MSRVRGRSPWLLDLGIAAVLLVGGVLESFVTELSRSFPVHLGLVVATMSAVALRRRFPLSTAGVVVVGMMAVDPNGQLSVFAALVVVTFTAGLEVDPPRSYLGLAVSTVPFYVAFAIIDPQVSDYVAVTVLYGGSWAVGQMVRQRTRQAAEQAARADRAEREREERAARAVAEERNRIARELHDIVAHSLSVVTLQTQAVRHRLDPALTREIADLQSVETAARQAMAEVRRLFGMLRAGTERPDLEPQPGLDQLDRLTAATRAAGTPVEVAVEGEPVPLPPGHDLAAYRVVQEALTNARKHAPGAPVAVCLRYRPGVLEVVVRDSGGAVGLRADDGGFGLVGMRERLGLYGGSLEAHPADGGFVVRAVLPLRENAPV